MTTQPQSGAAMEPTQADKALLSKLENLQDWDGILPDKESLAAIRQHVASETAELRKQLEAEKHQRSANAQAADNWCFVCTAQAAQIDMLRAELDEIEREASGALNNAFPEDAPDILANIKGRATRALAASTLGGDEKNDGRTRNTASPLIGSDPLSGAAEEKTP